MLLRLLSLVCLLLLSRASLTQEESVTAKPHGVPETCPVTRFSDKPFVPPYPYRAKPKMGGSWFGSDGLWIVPPQDGEIRGLERRWAGGEQAMTGAPSRRQN
jgi:hypothetical protein